MTRKEEGRRGDWRRKIWGEKLENRRGAEEKRRKKRGKREEEREVTGREGEERGRG